MLVVLAITGVLRGLQDTRTPLVAAVVGNGANIVLNVLLVYGVGPFPESRAARLRDRLGAGPGRRGGLPAGGRGPRRPGQGAAAAPDPPGIRTAAHAAIALVIRRRSRCAPRCW